MLPERNRQRRTLWTSRLPKGSTAQSARKGFTKSCCAGTANTATCSLKTEVFPLQSWDDAERRGALRTTLARPLGELNNGRDGFALRQGCTHPLLRIRVPSSLTSVLLCRSWESHALVKSTNNAKKGKPTTTASPATPVMSEYSMIQRNYERLSISAFTVST